MKKTFSIVALVLSICCVCCASAFAEESAKTLFKVVVDADGDAIALRSTPSSDGDLLTCIPSGTKVTIDSVQDEWGHLCYNNGRDSYSGWSLFEYMEITSLQDYVDAAMIYVNNCIEEYEKSDKVSLQSLTHDEENAYLDFLDKNSQRVQDLSNEDLNNEELAKTALSMLKILFPLRQVEVEIVKNKVVSGIVENSPQWFKEYGKYLYEIKDYLQNKEYLMEGLDNIPRMPTELDDLFGAIINLVDTVHEY